LIQDEVFKVGFEVRDHELDAQGIVNNANYQHYFEHARHRFLRSRGVDFVGLHEEGLDAIVHRIEIDYRESLRSGESFEVSVVLKREGKLRLVFEQELRKGDGRLSARARVVTAIVTAGAAGPRPVPPPPGLLERLLGEKGPGEDASGR